MNPESQATSQPTRSLFRLMVLTVAFALGALALASAVFGLAGRGGPTDQSTAWFNLITGITGVAGAIGYMLNKRWARYSYGASVLGHLISHGLLLLRAISSTRFSVGTVIGLSLVPALAVAVFILLERRGQSS